MCRIESKDRVLPETRVLELCECDTRLETGHTQVGVVEQRKHFSLGQRDTVRKVEVLRYLLTGLLEELKEARVCCLVRRTRLHFVHSVRERERPR